MQALSVCVIWLASPALLTAVGMRAAQSKALTVNIHFQIKINKFNQGNIICYIVLATKVLNDQLITPIKGQQTLLYEARQK